MARLIATITLVLLYLLRPAQAVTPAEEIEYLIDTVRHSACTFIRNGMEYDGAKAADHIAAKYDYYKSDIKTAEDFIDRAATKSALSGKPYLMRCGDGPTVAAADWLRAVLKSYRDKPP